MVTVSNIHLKTRQRISEFRAWDGSESSSHPKPPTGRFQRGSVKVLYGWRDGTFTEDGVDLNRLRNGNNSMFFLF